MRKLIENFLCLAVLLIALPSAHAFSLGGPIGNLGDSWQIGDLGYGLGGDLNAPKNLGEEYRRNVPYMYYAYDANFFGFYGLAGATNVDLAYATMNGVLNGYGNTPLFMVSPDKAILGTNGLYNGINITLGGSNNLDGYSVDLTEFPLEAIQYNNTMAALGLIDLKSIAMMALVEQMGLADPVRYNWTLHNIYQPPGTTCPDSTTFQVVQRNFDYLNSALNQVQYTPYVNDTLYYYSVLILNCSGPRATTVPINVDPFASLNSPVAALNSDIFGAFGFGVFNGNVNPYNYQSAGGYYVGLTRDDVAGLRYLMSATNFNTEATGVNGSRLLVTNLPAPVSLTTLPFNLLFSQSVTNDPDTLRTNYPGISILSVVTNYVVLPRTNIFAYFTNLAGPYTNRVPMSNNAAIYPAQGNTVPYTNWTPVQYGDPPILLTTLPLRPLLALAPFTDPVTLQGLYPGLLIDKVITNYLAINIETNVEPYFTNQSVLPVFNMLSNGLPYVTTLTNIYMFTNQPGPTVINYDFSRPFDTISTLDLALFSDRSVTNDPAAMVAQYPGLVINYSEAYPGFVGVTNYISYLTNTSGSPYPGVPRLVTKAVSTNFVFTTNWIHHFANVFTNHVYTNRFYRVTSIWITNVIGAPYGSPFVTVSNTKVFTTNLVSGDFFIMPTNWCGFDLRLTTPLGNPAHSFGSTNVLIYDGYGPNGSVAGSNIFAGTGNSNTFGLTQVYYGQFTNYNYSVNPGICQPVLRFGTNYSTNAIYKYEYNFINVVTNHYFTNALVWLFETNVFAQPFTNASVLKTNIVVTNYYTNLASGDFYIVPPEWCGYQIVSLLTNLIAPANIVLTNQFLGSNISYSYVRYLTYTNYTYSIRPGFCEPRLEFSTNYSTNIVTQYTYYFGNIITNNFYTNGQARVVITNISLVPGGLVGQLVTNLSTNFVFTGPDGDFTPIPPAWCDFRIIATQTVGAVYTTNTLTATNLAPPPDLGETWTQTTIYGYTNRTLLIQPYICNTTTSAPALRQGVQRAQFIRANYDSLLGQFFSPITNYYSMVKITNSQPIKEYYQRIITTPDFLMSARDQGAGGAHLVGGPHEAPVNALFSRNLPFDQSTVLPSLAGPGIIPPTTQIDFNKAGRVFINISPTFMDYTNAAAQWQWASFDGSTNPPVLYPNGTDLQNLANQIFIQVSPSTMPDGTAGVAYAPTAFTATGGQPPYVWAAPNLPALVPGMTFNSTNATISGTPTAAGVFNFNLQVTDSVNRSVNLNYSITIH